jgi:ABC-type phosphate transport system ATPase subunit
MAFARRVADYAIFLADGRILEAGPNADFFTHPKAAQTRDFFTRVLRY